MHVRQQTIDQEGTDQRDERRDRARNSGGGIVAWILGNVLPSTTHSPQRPACHYRAW